MGSAHHHPPHQHHVSSGDSARHVKVLSQALGVTLLFLGVEIVGGYLSNSLALLADAAHMAADAVALLLSVFVAWLSRRPASARLTFGYHRVEILGALVSGVGIWVIAGALVYEGVQRMASPPEVRGGLVSVVAAVGLLANLISMRILHSSQGQNLNVRAAYLHVMADALGSVGALVSGGVVLLTGWMAIDPLVTFLVAGLMVFSSSRLMLEALEILLESTPRQIDPEQVKSRLEHVEGVIEVHDLHVWSLSSGRIALSAHLIASSTQFTQSALQEATRLLADDFQIWHTTLQVEVDGDEPSLHCRDCSPA